MEDLASIPLNHQVIIQKQVSNGSLAPPVPPTNLSASLVPKKSFKGSLAKLELLVEVKTRLLNRRKYRENEEGKLVITDELYLDDQQQKQFTSEIKTLRNKINKIKGE